MDIQSEVPAGQRRQHAQIPEQVYEIFDGPDEPDDRRVGTDTEML